MTSWKSWEVVVFVCLAGCAGSGPALRSEHGPQPAALTGEQACRDPSALVLLCGERACAFYRCRTIALLENAALDGAARGKVVLALDVDVEVGPPRTDDSDEQLGESPEERAPVFVIPLRQPPPTIPLPPDVQAEDERLARLPHARHPLFPPGAEFRAWFASKGIAPDAWTIPVLVEDYFRINAGDQGGSWNVAWREFMRAAPGATPDEVWSYAGSLCLRFGIYEPVFAGMPSTPLKVSGEENVVRHVELDPAMEARADKALAECADLASKEVLARRMNGRNPTHRECLEEVGRDAKGQPITRAMQLGTEMHQIALECAREKLRQLHLLGFSIEQRYRYDPQSGRTVPVSHELEQALLRQGLGSELLGTIVPDVVLHTGNPARVQGVYDFKFPCVDPKEPPSWRKYPDGHPYQKKSQGEIYKNALGGLPARVVPGKGVIR